MDQSSITLKLAWTAAVAGMSSLQFGFHLAELNAPEGIMSCRIDIPGRYPNYADSFWGRNGYVSCIPMNPEGVATITTMFTIGGLLASTYAGKLADTIGRRRLMKLNSLTYMFGSLVMALSNSYFYLNIGRLICGLGAGAALVVTPMLINEVTPVNHRGFLGSLPQCTISLGIIIAQLLSYCWSNDQDWRFIFLLASGLGLTQFLLSFTVSESPKWLIISKGQVNNATRILSGLRTNSSTSISNEINHWKRLSLSKNPEMDTPFDFSETTQLLPLHRTTSRRGSVDPPTITIFDFLFSKFYSREKLAVITLMAAQQMTGINSITFYGVSMLSGVFPDDVLTINVMLSAFNFMAVIGISPFVDRLGRKPLLILSTALMGVSTLMISMGILRDYPYLVGGFCLVFVMGHSFGLGPIPFLMISEVTNHDAVGIAQSVGSTVGWCCSMSIAYCFPILNELIGGYVFLILTAVCCLVLLSIIIHVPETKEKHSFEQVWGDF